MNDLTVVVNLSVTEETDLKALEQRIADHLSKLSNPVRTDEGITTIQSVKVIGTSILDTQW
jgi:hypothetical protein